MPKRFALPLFTLVALMIWSVFFALPQAFAASPSPSPSASPKASPTVKKASPTPSPTVTTPSDEETTQKLKERIDKVLEERQNQVKGVVDQIGLKKRGFVGEVQRVTEKTLTVKSLTNSETLALTSDVILTRDGKKASIDDIAVGDWAIILGYVNNGKFELRRIVASSTSLAPKNFDVMVGSAQKVTRTDVTLKPRQKNEVVTYSLVKTTKYQDGQGKDIKREDIDTDEQYILIGLTDGQTKNAVLIRALGNITPTPAAKKTP